MTQNFFCGSCDNQQPTILAVLLHLNTDHHHRDIGLPPEDSVKLFESAEWPRFFVQVIGWN